MSFKRTYRCKVLGIRHLTDEVFTLRLERPCEMGGILPSQFFNLKASALPYLRRPISISKIEDDALEFTIIAKGIGTRQFQKLKTGDVIDVLGPLGNQYSIDENHKRVLIVGGGIGVPPQAVLAEAIKAKTNAHITVQLGFRDMPYMVDRFTALTDDVTIASENAAADYKGYVTDLTERALKSQTFDMVYVCGPSIVIEKVAALCKAADTPVQLLMEERMACGVGACMVCVCKVKEQSMPDGIWHKRVCTDGPVFYGSEVVFE